MKNKIALHFVLSALIVIVLLLFALYGAKGRNKKDYSYDIVFFGDSIVAGDHSDRTLAYKLAETSGFSVLNGAVGGLSLSYIDKTHYMGSSDDLFTMAGLSYGVRYRDFTNQIISEEDRDEYGGDFRCFVATELSGVNWDNAKYILIEHGANDYLNGVALDNPNDKYDPYTYGGALRTSIENIRVGAPKATIIIVTPIYMNPAGLPGDCFEVDYGGGFLADYVNKEKEIAEEYGIYVIDNFTEVPINKDNYDIYIPGGLHGSLEGNELIAANIAKHLKELDELN